MAGAQFVAVWRRRLGMCSRISFRWFDGLTPALVTCGIGNDDILGTPPKRFRDHLRQVIERLPSSSVVMDLTVPDGFWRIGDVASPYVTGINQHISTTAAARGLHVGRGVPVRGGRRGAGCCARTASTPTTSATAGTPTHCSPPCRPASSDADGESHWANTTDPDDLDPWKMSCCWWCCSGRRDVTLQVLGTELADLGLSASEINVLAKSGRRAAADGVRAGGRCRRTADDVDRRIGSAGAEGPHHAGGAAG